MALHCSSSDASSAKKGLRGPGTRDRMRAGPPFPRGPKVSDKSHGNAQVWDASTLCGYNTLFNIFCSVLTLFFDNLEHESDVYRSKTAACGSTILSIVCATSSCLRSFLRGSSHLDHRHQSLDGKTKLLTVSKDLSTSSLADGFTFLRMPIAWPCHHHPT